MNETTLAPVVEVLKSYQFMVTQPNSLETHFQSCFAFDEDEAIRTMSGRNRMCSLKIVKVSEV